MPLSRYCPLSPEHETDEPWRAQYVMHGEILCAPQDFSVLRPIAEIVSGTGRWDDQTYEYRVRIYCCDVDRLRRGIYAGRFMISVKKEKKEKREKGGGRGKS